MNDPLSRTYHFSGTPKEVGFGIGRKLGQKLEHNISRYLYYFAERPGQQFTVDMNKLHHDALPWLRRLPKRFQDEYEGMAQGAGLPLQRLAEWTFVEECVSYSCSGAVCLLDGRAWVARNNDTSVPDMWGYMTIREIVGRIPTITFSLEGDVFAPTGINQEKLWLHYNYLPVWDEPELGKAHLPGYVFLIEALETCRTIGDIEVLLKEVHRDGGMLLFAVDGKTEEFALFECTCAQHFKREPSEGWLVGTNHYCLCADPTVADEEPLNTLSRFRRLEDLVQRLYNPQATVSLPTDLIRILADDGIERRDEEFGTAYANVACPSKGEIWYTFGGYPAASAGKWGQVEWPWQG